MKNKLYLCVILFSSLLASSCKKESRQARQQSVPLENGLIDFSISGELFKAIVDTASNTITVVVADSVNEHKLAVTLTLASQVTATLDNIAINNNAVYDFTHPVVITVTSADKQRSTSFRVNIESEMEFDGFTSHITAEKSLNKDYNFYLDQFDGSNFQSINCGPTVTTMAIRWADSTFTKTPVYARSIYEPAGGWWYTDDVQAYLNLNNINNVIDTLQNIDSLVKTTIDNNKLMIICLDMYSVPFNDINYQHISKFYQTETTGWGHFLLAKGYKQAGNNFYLEIYDPYSQREHYPGFDDAQFKGQDRYYLDKDINLAAAGWWPYVIIVAPKGQKALASTGFQLRALNRKKPIPIAGGR